MTCNDLFDVNFTKLLYCTTFKFKLWENVTLHGNRPVESGSTVTEKYLVPAVNQTPIPQSCRLVATVTELP
jgi:hypothetical protein